MAVRPEAAGTIGCPECDEPLEIDAAFHATLVGVPTPNAWDVGVTVDLTDEAREHLRQHLPLSPEEG